MPDNKLLDFLDDIKAGNINPEDVNWDSLSTTPGIDVDAIRRSVPMGFQPEPAATTAQRHVLPEEMHIIDPWVKQLATIPLTAMTFPMRVEMRQAELEEEGATDPMAAYKEAGAGMVQEYGPTVAGLMGAGPTKIPMVDAAMATAERLKRGPMPLFDLAMLAGVAVPKLRTPKAKNITPKLIKELKKAEAAEAQTLRGLGGDVSREIMPKEPWRMTLQEFGVAKENIIAGYLLKDGRIVPSPDLIHTLPKGIKAKDVRDVGFIRRDTGEYLTRKQAAEFTGAEYAEEAFALPEEPIQVEHRAIVEKAIKEGKTTSHPEYPDLKTRLPVPAEEAISVGAVQGRLFSESGKIINPLAEIAKTTNEMIERAKMKPEIKAGVKEAKKSMIEHDEAIRNGEWAEQKFKQVGRELLPDKSRELLIDNALEHNMQPEFADQLSLQERQIAKMWMKEADKLNRFIDENNILERLPETKNFRHVYHHWKDPVTGEPFAPRYGKFSKNLPQAKQRKIKYLEDGLKLGLEPATTNPFELLGMEWRSAMQAHQTRKMIESLTQISAEKGIDIQLVKGKPARPIRMIERMDLLEKQGLTEGYKRWQGPVLDRAITYKTTDGRIKTIQGAVGVREEIYPFFKSYIESPIYGRLSELNFASKTLKLGLSLFHVQSLAMQEMANFRVPYWNIKRGLKIRKEMPPELKILHEQGLDLFKGYEDLGYRKTLFPDWGGVTGQTLRMAAKPIEMMRSFIFDVVQPGMKTSFAYDKYVKGLPKAMKEGLTEKQWAREVVKMADGHFSHEHYKRSLLETNRWMAKMYFGPESRKAWQSAMLSPTWQREHMLIAKNVSKSFMPQKMIEWTGMEKMSKTAKAEYRKYMLGAIMMVAGVDAYNLYSTWSMDGKSKHIWQNPPGKGFGIRAPWNEPDYVTDSGRLIKGGPAYIRPLKSIYEVAEWFKDPLQKFVNKLSPAFSAIGQQFWPGEYRHYKKGWSGYYERGQDLAKDMMLPISGAQVLKAIKGERSPWAAAFPFVGMPTSKIQITTLRNQTMDVMQAAKIAGNWDKYNRMVAEWNEAWPEFAIVSKDVQSRARRRSAVEK